MASSGTAGTTSAVGGGVTFDAGTGGSAPTAACSGDLRNVIDGSGNVVMTCPPAEGCLDGQCIAACAAADGSHSTIGCAYYAVEYPLPEGDSASTIKGFRGPCFATVIVNQWPTPATLTASRQGVAIDVGTYGYLLGTTAAGAVAYNPLPGGILPPNSAAVIFLSRDQTQTVSTCVACPAAPALATDGAIHETAQGVAFSIVSDRPVTAYSFYPWGGAPSVFPSATLLLPVAAWETNYVAPGINDKYEMQVATADGVVSTRAFTIVAASQDGTHVTVVPTVDITRSPRTRATPATGTRPDR
jgi:hypothetical protein